MAEPFNWNEALQKNIPDLMKHVGDLRQEINTNIALPAKTKILMTMLGDAILGHADGVANIANQARNAGASEEEIQETVKIAFMMGGLPALVTGANAFRK